MSVDILMPALSPTMEEGNIAEWSVQEGQEIQPGDALAQIETDKATVDFEATDGGFVAKILKPATMIYLLLIQVNVSI